jgi:hypothetical protein
MQIAGTVASGQPDAYRKNFSRNKINSRIKGKEKGAQKFCASIFFCILFLNYVIVGRRIDGKDFSAGRLFLLAGWTKGAGQVYDFLY